VQLAVWLDLNETMGVSLPIVNRAERRFAPAVEGMGTETSDEIWYPAEQATWCDEVTKCFPPDAIVMGEVPVSWLGDMTYRSWIGERHIANPKRFLEDVELKLKTLLVRSIEPSSPRGSSGRESFDSVVTLEGRLEATDGSEYVPVIVTSTPQTESIIYVIPAERAAKMQASQWEAVRMALLAQHGPANGRVSDDQGRGLCLPLEKGFAITSSDADKAGNYDVFRFFSHAIETRSHWRRDGGE